VASSNETFPLGTAEAIVLDGANSLGGAPRQHFPSAQSSAVVAVVAALVALAFLKRRPAVVLLVLLVAAIPGLVSLLVLRADAPTRRGGLATVIEARVTELKARARWPSGAVRVVREEDDVWFPLGRYALPGRPTPLGPAVELELVGASLGEGCRDDATSGHVVCGAAAR
jgi:hypothetical protein